MSQTDYLNAMGISTWVLREGEAPSQTQTQTDTSHQAHSSPSQEKSDLDVSGIWSFVIDQLSGDASLLFDKMLASLMLTRSSVQVLTSQEARAGKVSGQVVVAMGSSMTKQLLQLDESFDELRGAVHSLELGEDEWPVVLTYHPEHLLKQPKDKAKAWQDLLLARSLI